MDEAASKGDAMTVPNHATYYYGTMFGLEKARQELSALLASHMAQQIYETPEDN